MKDVFFIRFPKPKTQRDKCERWVNLCGRPKDQFNASNVKPFTFICCKHFVGGHGPTDDNPDPLPATACPEEIERIIRRRRKAPTPRPFASTPATKRRKVVDSANTDLDAANILLDLSMISPLDVTDTEENKANSVGIQTEALEPCSKCSKVMVDVGCQTVYDRYMLQSKIENIILKNEATVSRSRPSSPDVPPSDQKPEDEALLTLDDVKDDARKMKFFTGLSFLHFMALFNFLGPAVMESVASQYLWAVSDAGSPAEASPSPAPEPALIRWILDNRPVKYT
ncbi:unnamed protein product [Leuciscus chuanchicus]